MDFKRTIIPWLFSSAALAFLFYVEPGNHENPGPTKGDCVFSFIVATGGTTIYWILYVLADLLRDWRDWAAWTICPVVAVFCAVLTVFLYFQPIEVSGFERSSDVFYFFGIAFLPSLAFGLPYTALYYDPQRQVGQ